MKKSLVIKLISCCLLLACMLSLAAPVYAATAEAVAPASAADGARWEQTEWVFKDVDGVLYRRLWSNTYGVWLTGWIKA